MPSTLRFIATSPATRQPGPALPAATVTPNRPLSSSYRLMERVMVVFFLVALALSYGAFAAFALHSARSLGGALQTSDFNTAGTNPWAPALGLPPSPGQSLAHIGSPAVATP